MNEHEHKEKAQQTTSANNKAVLNKIYMYDISHQYRNKTNENNISILKWLDLRLLWSTGDLNVSCLTLCVCACMCTLCCNTQISLLDLYFHPLCFWKNLYSSRNSRISHLIHIYTVSARDQTQQSRDWSHIDSIYSHTDKGTHSNKHTDARAYIAYRIKSVTKWTTKRLG